MRGRDVKYYKRILIVSPIAEAICSRREFHNRILAAKSASISEEDRMMKRILIRWRLAYAFFLLIAIMTHAFDIARRPQVLPQFMRVMAEAAKILHTDKEFTFKVLQKRLRLDDRKVMEAA